ncbi:sigma-70 family RNA polymerase sigma factor [Aeromicrobium panaciterrae]|uniref:RNA polymerase sigma factor n=1 Tax=Aeromicrobium panaciterrae TaxID=363861 RepID=UPI0031D0C0FA
MTEASSALAETVRDEGRRVLATLIRTTGSVTLAEDAVQEAVVEALEHWPVEGTPDNPRAWLTTVARRKAVDMIRRDAHRTDKEAAAMDLTGPAPDLPESVVRDDLLRLVFTCCHPSLSHASQTTLSLNTLCGLRVADCARLMLTTEAAMARRLGRIKHKIAVAGIPYRIPSDAELPERLDAVGSTVYLMFTAGIAGEAVRAELCDEAIRLGRLLVDLMPDESSLQGLLALMLLTDARRTTRTDVSGDLVLLADQDRTQWDGALVAEGLGLVETALTRSRHRAGRFELQAAIAAAHASAASSADTDWADIVRLYDALLLVEPTDVVRLNRGVALGERDGPAAGLAAIDDLDGLGRFHLWHACRAELLVRLGRHDEARTAFDSAIACSPPAADLRHLERRIAAIR